MGRLCVKRFWWFSLSMSCIVSGQSRAEDSDLLAMSLESLLQTKITSSTLTDESIQTVPSSMTVFTRADIRRLGLQNRA